MPFNPPPYEQNTHQTEIELALCRRDHEILEAYHPALLIAIEKAVNEKHDPQQIKRWAQNVTNEPTVLQRVYNAARWLAR